MSAVGQAAGNSGQHPVWPASRGVAGSRERLDRPAAYPQHVDAAGLIFAEFEFALMRAMHRGGG